MQKYSMNYKTIANLHANFVLDDKYEVLYVVRDNSGRERARIPVVKTMDKGYIYAALYFYDDVRREIEKLEKMVRKIRDEVAAESPSLEAPIKMLYISNRVREVTGDDTLDALIKEMLAEEKGNHLALMPDKEETVKYDKVKEAIFTEQLTDFTKQTLGSSTEAGGMRRFSLGQKYIDNMTERQKAIYVPAIKMAAFLYGIKLNDFQMLPNFTVTCTTQKLPEPFAVQEEEIKNSIKNFIQAINL